MKSNSRFFLVKKEAGRWWRELKGDLNRREDRAALARLRRASIVEAMAEPATLDLFRRLGCKRHELPRVAAIACVLAHVREASGKSVIRLTGRTSFDDKDSVLKPLRFRRLLAARTDEELVDQMRRLVALADKKADPGHLAASMLFWSDKTRADWAFDYFNAGAPSDEGSSENSDIADGEMVS